jgi:hypothetical protein
MQRIPLDGKPLIPPAAVPAKLDPPPDPRPALPLETDLQPPSPVVQPQLASPPKPADAPVQPAKSPAG